MRRVGEPIESLVPAATASSGEGLAEPSTPLAFRWRGRRYVVGEVLAHWVETGAWWRHSMPTLGATHESEEPIAHPVPDPERQVWRVEACTRGTQVGVFDLCLVRAETGTRWSLRTIHD